MRWCGLFLLTFISACASHRIETPPASTLKPRAEHHAHLRSPEGADILVRIKRALGAWPSPKDRAILTAEGLIEQLDSAGIDKGLVLSTAYWFGMPDVEVEDEYARVRAENDWTGEQVARYPSRLVGFCSVNPLKDYALDEIDRCAAHAHLSGLKLHLGNARVNLRNPQDVAQLRRVFAAANRHRLPLVVHLRTSSDFGRREAEVFLSELLIETPDVPVQLAHLGGWGLYDQRSDEVLEVFQEAITAGMPQAERLYFDLAAVIDSEQPQATREQIADRLRKIGLERILFGSDGEVPGRYWGDYRRLLPLRSAEFEVIARNLPPYMQ